MCRIEVVVDRHIGHCTCPNFCPTFMSRHVTGIKIGPPCLNVCPTSTTSRSTAMKDKKGVSGKPPSDQGLVVA